MEAGGFFVFLKSIFGSLTFAPSYGANVSVFMWLILLMIVYNVVLALQDNPAKSAKLSKLTLMLGLFGTLYAIVIAVYDVGSEGIAQEIKHFELMARSAQALQTTVFGIMGWLLVSAIDFFKTK